MRGGSTGADKWSKRLIPLSFTYPQEVSAIIAIVSGVVLALATLALAVVDIARLSATAVKLRAPTSPKQGSP
jgi:hypothetical protein